jgi:hypothetical protein
MRSSNPATGGKKSGAKIRIRVEATESSEAPAAILKKFAPGMRGV